MAKIAKYRPPIAIPAIDGLTQVAQSQLQDFLRDSFTQIAEDLGVITQDDVAGVVITDTRVEIPAGAKRRISPPVAGTVAVLEAPSQFNSGAEIVIFLENPRGSLAIVSSPGVDDGGKVIQPLINGTRKATWVTAGSITLRSNGSNAWTTPSSFYNEAIASNPNAAGPTGATGPAGPQGEQGVTGQIGNQGNDGNDGPEGPQGMQGPPGANGPAGIHGIDGSEGPPGADGIDGMPGVPGPVGPQGPPGIPGPDGADGPPGADGTSGAPGPPGATGATGPAGSGGSGGSEGIILDPTEALTLQILSGTWDAHTSFTDSDGTLGSTSLNGVAVTTALATAGAVLDRTIVDCNIYSNGTGSIVVNAAGSTVLGALSLTAGQRVEFTAASGWRVFNADGSEKNTPGATGATGATGPVGPNVPTGITLSATTHILEVGITSGTYDIEAGFVDATATTLTGGSASFDAIAASSTIVTAPAASTSRIVDYVVIVAITAGSITVRKDISGVETTLIGPIALPISGRIEYTGLEGWRVLNPDGTVLSSITVQPGGRLGRSIADVTGTAIALTAAQSGEDIRFDSDITNSPAAGNIASWSVFTSTTTMVRVTGGNVTRIQGITAPTVSGQLICIHIDNTAGAARTLTLGHADGGATSSDQIRCPNGEDVLMNRNDSALLVYTGSRWRVVAISKLGDQVASYATLTSVTGATTAISLALLTVPASTIVAGTCFEIAGAATYVRNAGAGAVNATINVLVNGTIQAFYTTALPALPGPAGDASFTGFLHFTTAGAAGVARGRMAQQESAPAGATTVQNGIVIAAIDTTAAVTIEVQCLFSAGVASTVITGLVGIVKRMARTTAP